MTEYKLVVDTPEGTVFNDNVISIVFESEDGATGILANRSQGITALVPGKICIKASHGKERIGVTSHGVVVIEKERVHILTEDMLWEEDIDVERQKLNIKANKELLLGEKNLLHREYVLASAAVARAQARLNAKKN